MLNNLASNSKGKIIFEVESESKGCFFMTTRNSGPNESKSIVFVESEKFLKLWQREPYSLEPHLSHGNESVWKNDYKYNKAVHGFSFGITNPVPVPKIVSYFHDYHEIKYKRKLLFFKEVSEILTERLPYLAIDDGVTRTIFLLANKVKIFPVEVPTSQVDIISKYASPPGSAHFTLKQIYEKTYPQKCGITN